MTSARFCAVLVLAACARPIEARFPSWEPSSSAIPVSESREVARRRLAESRRVFEVWKRRRPRDARGQVDERGYSYVRVRQTAEDRIEVTLLGVRDGRVVLRALIEAHPDHLETEPKRIPPALRAVTRWVEREGAVGRHDGGAPALTVERLYDLCEREILAADVAAAPRLYFHPNGVLMHCGYLPSECSDCPTIAIQSLSRHALVDDSPALDPTRWVCSNERGFYAPGSEDPLLAPDFECLPSKREKKAEPVRASREPPRTPEQAEACFLSPSECGEQADEPATPPDICRIEPALCRCPRDDCERATWGYAGGFICGAGPARRPSFLDLGKIEPLAEWSFPFRTAGGVECSGESWLRRITPQLKVDAGP